MNRLRSLLKNPRIRLALIVLIVGGTVALFAQYLFTHPDVIGVVFDMHPAAIMLIALAYTGTILVNAFVLSVSLRMIGKRVSFSENTSLTGYSSVVNFFGPLQSGPGFRAAYLKQRHGVSLARFFYATLVFYAFFAAINGLIIAAALLWRTDSPFIALIMAAGVVSAGVGAAFLYRSRPGVKNLVASIKLSDPYFWLIGLGALLLSLCTAMAYFVELLHIDPTVTATQSIIYTAAANLALFVSLTPGAIGFRESFLLITQQLHQIPTDMVIAASIIDRSFYVLFLAGLFLVLLAIGARSKFQSKSS